MFFSLLPLNLCRLAGVDPLGPLNYLVQASQTEIGATTGGSYDSALKYLGSIQTPQAKQTLEAALDSPNPSIVQIAVVNLLYNQGGSDKAIQTIANQLEETSPTMSWMDWDLVLNLASQLQDNPVIQQAGQVYAQKSQDGSWQLATEERKNWPIYNWIGNYVVRLNK